MVDAIINALSAKISILSELCKADPRELTILIHKKWEFYTMELIRYNRSIANDNGRDFESESISDSETKREGIKKSNQSTKFSSK